MTSSEYRYSPAQPPAPCPDHPHCLLIGCAHFPCAQPVHLRLTGRGRPRRFCSTGCRVAEHRRLTS